MSRPSEDRVKIQCRLPRDKKAHWDKLLINGGFFFRQKVSIYPTYGEFLEALLDGDPRALLVVVKIFSKIIEKPLDKLE